MIFCFDFWTQDLLVGRSSTCIQHEVGTFQPGHAVQVLSKSSGDAWLKYGPTLNPLGMAS